jgi:invasion protein IalB
VAEVVMDDKLLGQLRSARTAMFIIFETPEEGIGFALSLNGIGEGYDKLPWGELDVWSVVDTKSPEVFWR